METDGRRGARCVFSIFVLLLVLVILSVFFLLRGDHRPLRAEERPGAEPDLDVRWGNFRWLRASCSVTGTLTAVTKLSGGGFRGGGTRGGGRSGGGGSKGGGSFRSPFGRMPWYAAGAGAGAGVGVHEGHKHNASSSDCCRCSLATVLIAAVLGTIIGA